MLALLVTGCAVLAVAGCGSEADDDASQITRTTTNIAGAGVIGLERDASTACPAPSTPDGASPQQLAHAAGTSTVPADPQRIVVLSTQALDAVCALGLWERVVGAVTLDGPTPQPNYLGSGIAAIPSIGSVGHPDLALIRQARPDLILGGEVPGSTAWTDLEAIAPAVFTGQSGDWREQFRTTAMALDRASAGDAALADYQRTARDAGVGLNAAQTEASVVRFTGDAITVQGTDSFAGQVLTDTGVRRPASQRDGSFTLSPDSLAAADGDLIYVVIAGTDGKNHAEDVMDSDRWRDLGAANDHRVFAMDDQVWSGNGVTAAKALVADLTDSLNGYVS